MWLIKPSPSGVRPSSNSAAQIGVLTPASAQKISVPSGAATARNSCSRALVRRKTGGAASWAARRAACAGSETSKPTAAMVGSRPGPAAR